MKETIFIPFRELRHSISLIFELYFDIARFVFTFIIFLAFLNKFFIEIYGEQVPYDNSVL